MTGSRNNFMIFSNMSNVVILVLAEYPTVCVEAMRPGNKFLTPCPWQLDQEIRLRLRLYNYEDKSLFDLSVCQVTFCLQFACY